MKLKNKILSVILVFALALSFSSCAYITDIYDNYISNAARDLYFDRQLEGQHPTEQPSTQITGALSPINYKDRYGYKSLSGAEKEVYDRLYYAALNYHRFFDLRQSPMSINEFLRIFFYFIDDNPEIFWLYPTIENIFTAGGGENISGVILLYLSEEGPDKFNSGANEFDYKVPDGTLYAMREEFNQKINGILASISPGDGELLREMKIFNYIAENIRYDYDLRDEIESGRVSGTIAQNAYGAAVSGFTVCSGFSKLFLLLSSCAGIECLSRYGLLEGGKHQWNVIRIGDEYYNVDPTEPVIFDGGSSFVNYKYFNVTDEAIQKTHTIESSVLNDGAFQISYDAPPCVSKESGFENVFGLRVSGGGFDAGDFSRKIERLYEYGANVLYISFPEGTNEDTVGRYLSANFAEMERLAAGRFSLSDRYYFLGESSRAAIVLTRG